jgi:hypothetical protein
MAREAAPDEPSEAKKCEGLEPDEKARPGPAMESIQALLVP